MAKKVVKQKTKDEFLKLLASDRASGNISIAAQLSGLSRQTIYNWRQDDFEFNYEVDQAIKNGKIIIADIAEQALLKRINSGDTTAIIFTLKSLRSKYYGEHTSNHSAEGENGSLNGWKPPTTIREAELSIYLWFKTLKGRLKQLNSPELEDLCDRVQKAMRKTQDRDNINEDDKS